jgi:hypothetical protein
MFLIMCVSVTYTKELPSEHRHRGSHGAHLKQCKDNSKSKRAKCNVEFTLSGEKVTGVIMDYIVLVEKTGGCGACV